MNMRIRKWEIKLKMTDFYRRIKSFVKGMIGSRFKLIIIISILVLLLLDYVYGQWWRPYEW